MDDRIDGRFAHPGAIIERICEVARLKQPFHIADLVALEEYMNELTTTISPFEVHLAELQLESILFSGTEFGLLWLDVLEKEHLRQLHQGVNQDLWQRFGNTQADYDGLAYHFHMK